MGGFSKLFGRRSTPTPSPDGSPVSRIQERHFRLALPGVWERAEVESAPGYWLYLCEGSQLAISVSVFNQIDPTVSLEDYMAVRYAQELSPEPHADLSEPEYGTAGRSSTATYTGTGPAPGRKVASLVDHDGRRLVQVYLEGFAPQQVFDDAWDSAMRYLEIAS